MRYATHAITELYRDWPHLPVGALVVLREDFDDKVAGWVDEYSASGLNSNSHLVDRLRLVRPSDGKRFPHVFNRRSPEKNTAIHSACVRHTDRRNCYYLLI